MPVLATIILVILISLVLASLLAGPIGWRHGRAGDEALVSWLFTILILLPIVWAATIWLPPAGPAIGGVHWVGPLLAGLLIAFLLAALAPPRRRISDPLPGDEPNATARSTTLAAREERVFADMMFWVFLALAVGIVVVGYIV